MADRLLCFVLMPFGMKKDPSGGPDIDFDHIYEDAIGPGIKAAGMEPVRADEVRTGGIAYDAMFERLLLCDFAVADLTTANAYVSYGLGVRHTARPGTTLTIFSSQQTPPFDLNYMRALPYRLGEGNRFGPHEAGMLRTALAKRLEQLRSVSLKDEIADSPVFHLIGAEGYKARDIARLQTDVFRDRVQYSVETKRALADARESRSKDALVKIEESFKALDAVEEGVLVDLFLSYRAVQAWDRMIELYERLPASLQRSVMLREQLAFALNRSKRRREAIEILEKIASEQG
ncbi:MAG TPA: TRAFs-binding domain-containing protein, partial [Pyrinomonadaceae bacterium]